MARKTILFLGYDLSDPYFKRLYLKATSQLDNFARRSYAFGQPPPEIVCMWCKRHGIEIIEGKTEDLLEALTRQRVHAAPLKDADTQPPTQALIPLPERPYKLLDHYSSEDAGIFFGRERETQLLTSLIHAHRLVLLYGGSGTGKTSLLLAGAVPVLERAHPPYETLYVRTIEDPRIVIRNAIRRRLPDVDLPETGSLVDFLAAATRALGRTLVIFLDQFEEFFIHRSSNFRAEIIAELGALYEARDVPVKMVFSLREDWLASMNEIRERIPQIFNIDMRLLPLTKEQARQAITAPAARLGVGYEHSLVDRLLSDLAAESTDGNSSTVSPPQLQLVCDALYEHAAAEGRRRIEIADYEMVGGVQGILARYIENSLREFPWQEREVAKSVLMALVSSQATRAGRDLESIVVEVAADESVVESVLDNLSAQRLVQRLEEGRVYELAHDVLAATIASWIDVENRQLKRARELLRREMADWQQDKEILISPAKFERIHELREALPLTIEEASFMLRAALRYDQQVPYWLDRIDSGDTRLKIIYETLESQADQARATAARYLPRYFDEDAALTLAQIALEDDESLVRESAAMSLGQMASPAAIDVLVEVANGGESLWHKRAIQALAQIQDVNPRLTAGVPGSLQGQIRYTTMKIRFRQAWPRIRRATIAGAIAGATGFALGLTPPLSWHFASLESLDLAIIITTALLFALPGLLAGAGLGFGISTAEALFKERASVARVLLGVLFGAVGFAALLPFVLSDPGAGIQEILSLASAWAMFGAMTALGIALLVAIRREWPFVLGGGALGGAIGIMMLGALASLPFPDAPQPVVLISGALLGLIMASGVVWMETQGTREENAEQHESSLEALPAA